MIVNKEKVLATDNLIIWTLNLLRDGVMFDVVNDHGPNLY